MESFGSDPAGLWRKTSRVCSGVEGLRGCIAFLNRLYVPRRYPDA